HLLRRLRQPHLAHHRPAVPGGPAGVSPAEAHGLGHEDHRHLPARPGGGHGRWRLSPIFTHISSSAASCLSALIVAAGCFTYL
ncbi:unnamed protein product, partial [Prorocentrum cordatum]